jgi:hypothetical protein
MEATCSSKVLVDFQQTTGRYIPEDRTLWLKLKFIGKISDGIRDISEIGKFVKILFDL